MASSAASAWREASVAFSGKRRARSGQRHFQKDSRTSPGGTPWPSACCGWTLAACSSLLFAVSPPPAAHTACTQSAADQNWPVLDRGRWTRVSSGRTCEFFDASLPPPVSFDPRGSSRAPLRNTNKALKARRHQNSGAEGIEPYGQLWTGGTGEAPGGPIQNTRQVGNALPGWDRPGLRWRAALHRRTHFCSELLWF